MPRLCRPFQGSLIARGLLSSKRPCSSIRSLRATSLHFPFIDNFPFCPAALSGTEQQFQEHRELVLFARANAPSRNFRCVEIDRIIPQDAALTNVARSDVNWNLVKRERLVGAGSRFWKPLKTTIKNKEKLKLDSQHGTPHY